MKYVHSRNETLRAVRLAQQYKAICMFRTVLELGQYAYITYKNRFK